MLDIDSLMQESSQPSTQRPITHRPNPPLINRTLPRRTLPNHPHKTYTTPSYPQQDDYAYNQQSDDTHYDMSGGDENFNMEDDYGQTNNYNTTATDDNHSPRSATKKSVTFSGLDHHTPKKDSPDSVVVTPGMDIGSDKMDDEPEKISYSKTTKKLVFTAPPKRQTDTFKPVIGDNMTNLGLGDIMGASQLSQSSATGAGGTGLTQGSVADASRSVGAINHEFWLHRSPSAVPEVAMDTDEPLLDGTTTTAAADATLPTPTPKKAASAPATSPSKGSMTGTDANLPPDEEYVNIYWLDACETNGVIYLFGKIPINEPNVPTYFVSCCVAVHGAERNLFALPKATGEYAADGTAIRANMANVYQEIGSILVPSIIPRSQGQSYRCKTVKRKYAFEHGDVPREETSYMKIVYSATHPAMPLPDCNIERKYIEKFFGSSSSPLELFLLKRKLMGPCWITIRKPCLVKDTLSWCKLEIGIENPKLITRITLAEREKWPCPPLISMCVSIKTVLNPTSHLHEIVAISGNIVQYVSSIIL